MVAHVNCLSFETSFSSVLVKIMIRAIVTKADDPQCDSQDLPDGLAKVLRQCHLEEDHERLAATSSNKIHQQSGCHLIENHC